MNKTLFLTQKTLNKTWLEGPLVICGKLLMEDPYQIGVEQYVKKALRNKCHMHSLHTAKY